MKACQDRLTDTVSTEIRKWESNEGSDPHSYGFNQDMPPSAYRNASYLIHTLVDIVAKNGNYLLDVGPMANGTIHPSPVHSLLEVGRWLNSRLAFLSAELVRLRC
jgi:alpha-L-fucosidase